MEPTDKDASPKEDEEKPEEIIELSDDQLKLQKAITYAI